MISLVLELYSALDFGKKFEIALTVSAGNFAGIIDSVVASVDSEGSFDSEYSVVST